MATGSFEGKDVHHPDIRAMFTREAVPSSAWYQARLVTRQQREIALQQRHVAATETVIADSLRRDVVAELGLTERLGAAKAELARVSSADYLASLEGTIGADPLGQTVASDAAASAPAEPVGV